jgi:hypothetical protein
MLIEMEAAQQQQHLAALAAKEEDMHRQAQERVHLLQLQQQQDLQALQAGDVHGLMDGGVGHAVVVDPDEVHRLVAERLRLHDASTTPSLAPGSEHLRNGESATSEANSSKRGSKVLKHTKHAKQNNEVNKPPKKPSKREKSKRQGTLPRVVAQAARRTRGSRSPAAASARGEEEC